MLSLKHISVSIEDKHVISDLSADFVVGKNYCLLGKNGSGKSSLALAIMGHPHYSITAGEATIEGEALEDMTPDVRAQKGIFLAFQTIPEIKGVKVFEFLRTIYNIAHDTKETFVSFKKIIVPLLEPLRIDKEFLRRDLNVGFSGGERRKLELLQLRLLTPRYILLDEVDSGLDVDAFKAVAKLLAETAGPETCLIIITHYFTILEYITVDEVLVLQDGKIIAQGDITLVERIKADGFEGIDLK
jgi:Fe-S cluster assembly ATP-binding protein